METKDVIQLPVNMTLGKVEGNKVFLKPVFEDGDVLVSGSTGKPFIYNGKYDVDKDCIGCYFGIGSCGKLELDPSCVPTSNWSFFSKARAATKQELKSLFNAISDAGYVWNEQSKRLKKLKRPGNTFPETWEEFCYAHPAHEEYFIDSMSHIGKEVNFRTRDKVTDRNLCKSKEYANAFLALMQLIQLRDCYRNGWKPCSGDDSYWIASSLEGELLCCRRKYYNKPLSFQSEEICKLFLENFRDLIKRAKDLI